MRYFLFVFLTTLIMGCSPVNSLQPFDQVQAAILISEQLKPQAKSKFKTYKESLLRQSTSTKPSC